MPLQVLKSVENALKTGSLVAMNTNTVTGDSIRSSIFDNGLRVTQIIPDVENIRKDRSTAANGDQSELAA